VQLTLSIVSASPRDSGLAYSFDGVNQAGAINLLVQPGPTVTWTSTQGPQLGGLWVGKVGGVTMTAQTIELHT
jgi:hypothetical protein